MMDWSGRTAVVTGANSGIGYEVAHRLLDLGMVVVALDRTTANIKESEATGSRLHALEVDLSQDVEVSRAFQWVDENCGGVDVLVNNAGLGGSTTLLEGRPAEWRRLTDVNVIALAHCAAEAVRSMRKRNVQHGQIINLTSNLAHYVPQYGPFHFYSATKHAARAITEGLRQELRALQLPIRVSCLSPGLVRTGIFKSSIGEQMDQAIFDKYPSIEPADVASAVEYILRAPLHVNLFEINIKPTGSEY